MAPPDGMVICTTCKRICMNVRDWNMCHLYTGKASTTGGTHMYCTMFLENGNWRNIVAQD